MAYWQWGDPAAAHTVLCVHGLTRQGRDFDVLAQTLVARADGALRVVCPDVVGRGKSDWLTDPMGYQIPHYVGDMLALLAHLKPHTLDWVGTSMGGLIGMVAGLVGAGGAFISVPFMVWCNVAIHSAVATSAALGFPIALANTVGYVIAGLGLPPPLPGTLGYLSLPALAVLATASVLVAPLGARVAHRLDTARLKKVFAVLLYGLAAFMLQRLFPH